MTTRKYSSRSQQTTLSSGITAVATTMTVGSASNLMASVTPTGGETYTVVIDPDTAVEEIVDVTGVSGSILTIVRGIDNAGTGSIHSAGAIIRHMVIGRDLREANLHIEATAAYNDGTGTHTVHGVSGSVVGTTDSQTLTNKIIAAGSNTITGITSAMITDGTIVAGDIANGTITAAKLVADPFARANHTGTQTANTVSDFDTQVRTSRLDQMAAPTASVAFNSQKITGLGTPTANTTDAATTAYVDTSISNLIAGAPSTLNTLDEIAAALNDTANFSDTVVLKTGSTMSGALAMGTNKITGLGEPTNPQDAVTKNYLDTTTLAPSNLTGPITSSGSATSIASQTGTGTKFVVDTSPTLITPVLGIATATSINGTVIPSSATLVTNIAPTISGTITASGDINLTAAGGPGSLIDELTLLLMGAI